MNPIMLNLLNVVVVLVPISFCYLKLEMCITLEYSWNSEEPLKCVGIFCPCFVAHTLISGPLTQQLLNFKHHF